MSTQIRNRQVATATEHLPGAPELQNALHDLRALVPNQHVSHIEALRITERQASALRRALGAHDDYFDVDIVGHIPRISVQHVNDLPAKGASFWGHGTWHIHVRTQESTMERRFTVLHELKHVLDHPTQHLIYDERALVSYGERELIADYFARCVLMPANRLRRLFATTTDRDLLAARFGVTRRTVQQRLSDIGLTRPTEQADAQEVPAVVNSEAICERRAA